MTTERIMPAPWFRAQASAYCIAEVTRRGNVHRLPREGERQCGPYVLPPFQRPPVWTRAQQIKLIESLWDGLPIGSYCYNEAEYEHPCDGWLLDGQQRITAIVAYVGGAFPVHGWLFPDLPIAERRGFGWMPFGVLKTRINDVSACREVYERLAYGGTPHDHQNGKISTETESS